MKPWTSHTLLLNGNLLRPENRDEYHAKFQSVFDPLMMLVWAFYEEWTSENEQLGLQTSGSTGKPKTILVSKQSMMASAYATNQYFGLSHGMKALLCLSPQYIAGKMMLVRAMLSGMDLVTSDVSANPIEKLAKKIDFAAMVPLQVNMILNLTPEKMNAIRILIIGGSALESHIEMKLQTVVTQCFHTYGMTETLSHIAMRPINGRERTTWFTPFENIQISLDQRACLTIMAPFVHNMPIITNDMAVIDAYGRFKILGRIDNIIVSAGMKIQPEEVERKIRHLFNKPFIISSMANDMAGENVMLYTEETLEIKALYTLWKRLSECLEQYEMPRQIEYVERIPFLKSGKMDRKRVKSEGF